MLNFKPITASSLAEIRPCLRWQSYRTCDYTLGALYLWSGYFKCQYCVYMGTLFCINGDLNDKKSVSFSIPVGELSFEDALELIRTYAEQNSLPLVFTFVPEDALASLAYLDVSISYERDWSDYLYSATDLALLPGKQYHRKKNHINKFFKLYPDYRYERISSENIAAVKDFFAAYSEVTSKDEPTFSYDEEVTRDFLEHYDELSFALGGAIMLDKKVIAFCIGEIVNDTLTVHIEKGDRSFDGVYQVINQCFAKDMLETYDIEYINREDDAGDDGLRLAKLSYLPTRILNKYTVSIKL